MGASHSKYADTGEQVQTTNANPYTHTYMLTYSVELWKLFHCRPRKSACPLNFPNGKLRFLDGNENKVVNCGSRAVTIYVLPSMKLMLMNANAFGVHMYAFVCMNTL